MQIDDFSKNQDRTMAVCSESLPLAINTSAIPPGDKNESRYVFYNFPLKIEGVAASLVRAVAISG